MLQVLPGYNSQFITVSLHVVDNVFLQYLVFLTSAKSIELLSRVLYLPPPTVHQISPFAPVCPQAVRLGDGLSC